MERGFSAGQKHSTYTRLAVYLQRFTSCSDRDIGRKLQLFLPLAFNAPVGVFPLEFLEKVWFSEN